jgi:Terminase-like family.
LSSQHLARRLEKIEASEAAVEITDLRTQIIDARGHPLKPTHTAAELSALAELSNDIGRIARGWLRIGFTLPDALPKRRAAPVIDPAKSLATMAGYFFDKPLEFVLFSYEWDRDRSLQVVKLPEAYQLVYHVEHGPDAWACELLEEVGHQVRARRFDGRTAVDSIREAISSGHGIGKSATTAWLVDWIMSTRPNARGIVTAATSPQLESKTWAEIGKWTKRCIFGSWFNVTTGKGSMRMSMREHPESWRCDAQTSREENSESFAGLHAADSTPFYLFDEASAIPAAIWQVAEGGMTDGEPMWFAFGNPTRNTGKFFECFNAQRHRWTTRQIDSRDVALTNKSQIGQWVDDFGEESDFVKVRVRGVFPSASSLQFIGRELVDDAAGRELFDQRGEAVIIGVDPARFGDDSSVIWTRCGRDARSFEPIRLRGIDTMTLASRVAEHANRLRSTGRFVLINVDGGGVGGGVVDRLRSLNYDVNEVQFGGKANDPKKYANKRAEIWGAMRDWLAGGAIPKDEGLATDLCSVEYGFNASDQILLERKESMKSRGLASPDAADALAITFAAPVPIVEGDGARGWDRPVKSQRAQRDYDPMAILSKDSYDPYR